MITKQYNHTRKVNLWKKNDTTVAKTKRLTRGMAIRQKCLDCCNYQKYEVKRRLQYEVDRTFSGSTHVAETHSKKVYQYSSDGTFIRKWSSANEIERQTGFNQDSICDCCNGKHESVYGFVWRYAT